MNWLLGNPLRFGNSPGPAALWWLPLVSYLLGSVPFGYLVVRLSGRGDIRAHGSGNIGATNVARETSNLLGLLTLLLDAGKGFLAVAIAARASGRDIRWMMLAVLLTVLGHMFPVWLRWRGGRGVATAVGVFLPVCWQAVAGAFLVWIVVVGFWRFVSLASISAAASLPLLVYLLYAPQHAPPPSVEFGTMAVVALIILRHRSNIVRLLNGTEPRFTLHHNRRHASP